MMKRVKINPISRVEAQAFYERGWKEHDEGLLVWPPDYNGHPIDFTSPINKWYMKGYSDAAKALHEKVHGKQVA